MTFAVRSITRSVAGRDIVHRPQVFETSELVIGRGSDCEIRLADLTVSLRHATLKQTGPGRVSVTSIGTEPFEANGKFTSQADLSLADNPKLAFGSYNLALSESTEDSSVLVDVTRLEAPPETAAAANEKKIFSLAGSGFSKRPIAWSLAAAALALCLILPIFAYVTQSNRQIHADQQWSTGPLSKSHAFLNKNCGACHVKAFVSVRDETCLACHQKTQSAQDAMMVAANEHKWDGPEKVTLITDHADHDLLLRAAPLPRDPVGRIQALFRRTFNHPNERCASCHLEHLADAPVKGAASAAPQPREVPVLRTTSSCADCHEKLREHLGTTALRDTPDWRHHPEFRPFTARTPLGMSKPRLTRISLVEHPGDYTGLIFSHMEHLSKTGGVARMAGGLRIAAGGLECANCHRPTKDGKAFEPVEMTRDCSGCHSLAYAPGKVLPHGHPDQVIAAMQGYEGGVSSETMRHPPGFLTRLGMIFSGRSGVDGPGAGKVRALFAPKGLCAECHAVRAPAEAGSLDYKIVPVNQTSRYLPWGDFDHSVPAHRKDAEGAPTCASCHMAETSSNPNELLLPRIAQCSNCHGKTKEKSETAASADCAECHSYHAPGMSTRKTEHEPPAPANMARFDLGPAPARKLASAETNPREF